MKESLDSRSSMCIALLFPFTATPVSVSHSHSGRTTILFAFLLLSSWVHTVFDIP